MDDDKITQILEMVTELKTEVSHLTQRMNDKSSDIKELREDMNKLKIQLALNDQKTNKLDKWLITIFSSIITLLLGYIAVQLGLK